MNYQNEYIEIEEIKAETLISQTDIEEENINVVMQGIFSRNYSEDLISITNEKDNTVIELSRDGIFHLLPEGLFFNENQLKKANRPDFDFEKELKELENQKEAILLFFKPFDTKYFKLSLEMEKKLNAVVERGNRIFLDAFWDEPEIETKNEYISKIILLLPFVSHLRGNMALLIDILKNIFSVKKIEIEKKGAFYHRFIIHKEGLSKEEYQSMDKSLIDFFHFFRHWFLPVEMEYDYRIKDYKEPFILGSTLLLDYNTHL